MNPASTRLAALLLCATALATYPDSAEAQGTLVLGDSLSDTGNAFRLTGGAFPDPQFYADGRLSNGQIWADRLVPRQGYYAELITAPRNSGPLDGWNFAVAGALSGAEQLDPVTMRAPGLLTQVRDYKAFVSAGVIAPGARATSALIWSGANDYGMRATDPARSVSGDTAFVTSVVANLRTASSELISAGFDEVVLLNQFDFSKAPTAQLFPSDVRVAGDAMTTEHNRRLLAAASQLHGTGGARVILVDVDRLFDDVFANPSFYGLADVNRPCLPDNGPPECASAADANKRVFWDGTHLTTAAHALVAAAVTGTRQAAVEAPRQAAVLGDIALALTDAHRRSFGAHLEGASPVTRHGLSLSVTGEQSNQTRTGISGRSGYEWDGSSFGVALDQAIGGGLRLGVAGSLSSGDYVVPDGMGRGRSEAISVSGFLAYTAESFSAELQGGRSWIDFETERATGFAPAARAEAQTSGAVTFADAKARYALAVGPITLAPSAGLRWTRIQVKEMQETGGGLMNVRSERQARSSLIGSLGARAELGLGSRALTIRPFISGQYERELLDGDWTSAVVLGSGQRFAVEAGPSERSWVALEAGLAAKVSERVEASAAYSTRLRLHDDEERAFTAGLKIRF